MHRQSRRHQALFAIALAAVAVPAVAQYKWQTPDGRTVYGDVPPPGGAQRMNEAVAPVRTAALPERPVELPYALKQVAGRQPVVLYTASECAPCQTARDHLSRRGIPFSERTIGTTADFEALKAQGFASNGFPAMSIGRERTVGFEASSWDRLLTAAGYPRQSQLPAGYRQPAAEPMAPREPQQTVVTVQTPGAAGGPSAAAQAPQQQRAIDQYRAQLQADRPRTPETPSMRF